MKQFENSSNSTLLQHAKLCEKWMESLKQAEEMEKTALIDSPINYSLFLSMVMLIVGKSWGWAICTSRRKGISFSRLVSFSA